MAKDKMKIVVLFLIINSALFSFERDDIWTKAEKIATQNESMVAKNIHRIQKRLNGKGDVIEDVELFLETVYEPQKDSVKVKFVKGTNDKKVLEGNETLVEKLMQRDFYPKKKSLFHNWEKQVKFQKLEESELDEKVIVLYAYEREVTKEDKVTTEKGKIWFDKEKGVPLKREFTFSPSIHKNVTFLKIEMQYGFENSKWVLRQTKTTIEGKWFFFRTKIESSEEYANYWDLDK